MWRAGLAPGGWLLFPLLASAYGFCRDQAKTDDGYFLGFPSYWNIVAFYCYFLALPGTVVIPVVPPGDSDVRSIAIPVSQPDRRTQPRHGRARGAVDSHARRRLRRLSRVGAPVVVLPGVLHGRVMVGDAAAEQWLS